MKLKMSFLAASVALLLTSVQSEPLGMPTRSTPDVQEASAQANKLFDEAFQERLERSPSELSALGIRKFYDRWDDISPGENRARYLLGQKWAQKLKKDLKGKTLDSETELSLQLYLYNQDLASRAQEFEDYDYPVNQMHGLHAEIPAFLINIHQVRDVWDAEAYIGRLEGLPALMNQLSDGLLRREKKGIMPPRFVFDYVISDVDNLLTGFPLTDSSEKQSVYRDLETKIEALDLSPAKKQELLQRGRSAIKEGFAPAYRALRETLVQQRERASSDDGVWKFPEGDKFYAYALARTTTTEMTAQEIHDLGLSEVERIHGEMKAIMKKVGFQGSLQEFFQFMRDDKQFYYPDTEAGKKAYLDEATAAVDKMKAKLDGLFLTKPKADLVVKRVEAFREKSAGKAFYEVPSLDGSRPGYYYANLYDMSSMPKYQMEALAYHEGIPGHHMQLSIAQEMEALPKFRRLGGYTAYIEGWGLYSERLPKEYGFYADPYADFGRLAMELWRACRLVVDTGIHHKRWTREQGVDYYMSNTPNPKADCQKMVDRHIVMPGQATAYKVGMNEILRLRESAKKRLGEKFDIREFHDVVLTHGAVPLAILEKLVDDYVGEKL